MGAIYIGISGWRYEPWRGVFYPRGLAQARELDYASRFLPTIEINGSFYSLQRPSSYAAWYDATPPGFLFAVKGNRFLTHMLKLRGIETPLANVLASGVFALREKLGPFLWQFPPQLRFDADKVEHFLSLLPHDTGHALAIARGHDEKLAGRALLEIDAVRRCATPSRCATTASATRPSSRCCASTTWRWWWPIRPANGRTSTT
jgi:uncharacterized protein YecE (DUF72 family)